MSPAPETVHGTALALGPHAVLIRGGSGAGKSDLALRCIATPPLPGRENRIELVSDDQVQIVRTAQGLEVSPPPSIAGKIEVRGVGIVELPYRPAARLTLVVDLVAASDVPRYPLEAQWVDLRGVAVPLLRLAPFEASTPVKIILALERGAFALTQPPSAG